MGAQRNGGLTYSPRVSSPRNSKSFRDNQSRHGFGRTPFRSGGSEPFVRLAWRRAGAWLHHLDQQIRFAMRSELVCLDGGRK
jgi:hypothetical protein